MTGVFALCGGGMWSDEDRDLLAQLVGGSAEGDVAVVLTAAAYERPDHVGEAAQRALAAVGANAVLVAALTRSDASDPEIALPLREAGAIVLVDGSAMHLRSTLKGTPLLEAIAERWNEGATLIGIGAGATLLGDPMIDPRGGAYTTAFGFVGGIAVFPHHDTTPAPVFERTVELQPADTILVGVDEGTTLCRSADDSWRAAGRGVLHVHHRGRPARRLESGWSGSSL